MVIASSPRYVQSKALNLHAFHHLFYTLSMFTQPIVVLVYWGVVHQSNVEETRQLANGNQKWFEDMLIHTVLVHILPGLCCLALFLINQTVLIKRQSAYLIAFGIFYGFSNFLAVKKSGQPLYWFLTWEDHWSIVIAATIITVFTSLFYLTACIDEYITGRSASAKK